MNTIISTKILTHQQKKILVERGYNVSDFNFIELSFSNFEIQKTTDFGIITSKNALKSCLNNTNFKLLFTKIPFVCVGQETKKELEKAGLAVVETANYGSDLAAILVEKYPNKNFTFFSGNLRRDELPNILNNNKVELIEIEVYKTQKKEIKIKEFYDFILFYSPSGVESFAKNNVFKHQKCIAIGTTTAYALQKYTSNIYVAQQPTVESVIQKLIETNQ